MNKDKFKHYKIDEWTVSEVDLDFNYLNKSETLFSQGNGYLSVRGGFEEVYYGEQRNTFVSGVFNTVQGEHEVAELVNIADFTNTEIYVNGERFVMNPYNTKSYKRQMNYQTGELKRTLEWTTRDGIDLSIEFKRFVSLEDKHLLCASVSLLANKPCQITIVKSINGMVTNHGASHFEAGEMKYEAKKIGQFNQTTTQSQVTVSINSISNAYLNSAFVESFPQKTIGRRDLVSKYNFDLEENQELVLETISNVYTDRDLDHEPLNDVGLNQLIEVSNCRYDYFYDLNKIAWQKFWDLHDIRVESNDVIYQLNIRFALYHLRLMTPVHDNRMGIGAKGFTGEDYKGHSFWDTEIFILPFWIMSDPEVARNLLIYRYKLLNSAKEKAQRNGYLGAMYPWESGWITDLECTPEWGNIDVVTNKREPIWTGKKQIHITADIIYAMMQYVKMTGDQGFLDDYGYEMIYETAKFWTSRLEYNQEKDRYEILDVIGPDEYCEHIDNNAFTNYMCYWNIELAVQTFEKVDIKKYGQDSDLEQMKSILKKIYIPASDETGLIAQDDSYLNLSEFPELQRYKFEEKPLAIFKKYSMVHLHDYQVSKQADMVMLMLILKDKFSNQEILRNFDYYEQRTLHDSSLSYSMHAILAGQLNMPYYKDMFEKALEVDLNDDAQIAKTGIHAASIGGIWQNYVFALAGIGYYDGKLSIDPKMIDTIDQITFKLFYKGELLSFKVTERSVDIENLSRQNELEVYIMNKAYTLIESLSIELE
ncbi:glycoside hydrolase family 65 protein [Acidaminobacter sp. JC074]|uniref:glycoside hydrolase family 65 protein n=1 Tax=Acidaminobacter sp. JC074 TaxID=2530199 RepID=UPI001F10B2FC|nr:glycosyl hydrolase family 65 protein [Acidaminobacter sp. JC074]MCH4889629.1 glycoside hydrolase family 65 protein [Acidaminobacter sp. JC074]